MITKELIREVEKEVQRRLSQAESGHDFFHADCVRRTALLIATSEGADSGVVELAALLHDIADWKFHDGDETVGPRVASEILSALKVDQGIIDKITEIISTLSYKGASVATPMRTLEGKVVQDADRLQGMGAIGIARTFAYGGNKGRVMYDPAILPFLEATKKQYMSNIGTSINHFYEKLLLLKDRMQTESGRKMAESRHQFMEEFLRHFLSEWEGKE